MPLTTNYVVISWPWAQWGRELPNTQVWCPADVIGEQYDTNELIGVCRLSFKQIIFLGWL